MAASLPEAAYGAALATLPGVGPARLLALLRSDPPNLAWARVSAGEAAVEPQLARVWASAASAVDVARVWESYIDAGVDVHVLGTEAYPAVLASDHQPPAVLFSKGTLAAVDRPRVAIVGTRRCTRYGREVARSFGRDLAAAGVSVVSGLAAGIDGAAHEGALAAGESGAPPIAVVGCGHDIVYPRVHAGLWRRVATEGLLLSEAPLGARPEPWRFPARNRVIAALADLLVVVESHRAGGSMHTVEAANDRGLRVLAVPGPVLSPSSQGTNRLLAEGCGPATDVDDIVAALQLDTIGVVSRADRRPAPEGNDAAVLAVLDWTPANLDQLVARTGLRPPAVALALGHLESGGWAASSGGWWERAVPEQ